MQYNILRPVHTRQQSCQKRQQIVAGNGKKLLPETATNCCPKRQQFDAKNGNKLLPDTATLLQHLSKSPFLATICCRFRHGVDRPLVDQNMDRSFIT